MTVATLETTRLILLPWTADDVGLLARLSADPRVVRHVGEGQPWTASRAIEVSDHCLEHWHQHGFGWRTIIRKSTGDQIGLLSLNLMGDGAQGVAEDAHEIGWWIDPGAWGVGYAREAARCVADDAFTTLEAPDLTARILPRNAASIAVATSLGMTHIFDTIGRFEVPCSIYRITRPVRRPWADNG